MPSEKFDGNTLRRITNLYKTETGQPDKDYDYRDTVEVGLCIKVRKRGAVWYMLTRKTNARIGGFSLFDAEDIPALRTLVAEAKVLEQKGMKPDALFQAFVDKRDVGLAKQIHDVVRSGAKTWEEARDEFLAWSFENKAKATTEGYRSALGACANSVYEKDFAFMAGKPLKSIGHYEMACVIESIEKRGKAGELKGRGLRQANLTVAAIRSLFKYVMGKPSIYGIIKNPASELLNVGEKAAANEEAGDDAGERALSQLEIGAFIHGLDRCGNPIAQLALFLQLLTGQRRFTAISPLRASFYEHPTYGLTWRLRAKGDNWRVLPLPPMAQDIVRAALEKFEKYECRYLFPKARHRHATDDMQMHINKRTVSDVVEEMRNSGGVFHQAEMQPSTHDFRKAFTTHMRPRMHEFTVGGRQLIGDDVQMITHVNEGRDTTSAEIYDKNAYLDVKLAILKAWEDYCMEGYTMYMQQFVVAAKAA